MTRTPRSVLPLLALGLLAALPASAQVPPGIQRGGGACFYEDADFGGRSFCLGVGEARSSMPAGANDQVSSVQLFGTAEVTLYRDAGFRGKSVTLTNDARNLRGVGMNDEASSVRVDRRDSGWDGSGGSGSGGGGWGGGWNWGYPEPPRSGACFFEHANFEGRSFCARAGQDLSNVPPGFNDGISSIRLFGNATVSVFRDSYFEGSTRRFDREVGNLRREGWNDRISSIRVEKGGGWGGGGGSGWGGGGGQAACFFTDADYRGRSFCFSRGENLSVVPAGFNDQISSIRVTGGARVTVYEDSDFRGATRRFQGDVRNLDGVGFNDRISSVRIE